MHIVYKGMQRYKKSPDIFNIRALKYYEKLTFLQISYKQKNRVALI